MTLSAESGQWSGVVGAAEHLGSDTHLHVQVDDIGQVTARASGEFGLGNGDRVYLTADSDRVHRFGADGKGL